MAGVGRRATITDVARLADVSIKTVSRVVNGASTVDPALAARVRAAVVELNYRPNQLASTLKSGSRTSSIGFIGKRLATELEATMMLGAETIVRRHAAHLVTASGSDSASSAEDLELAADLIQRRVDGLLIVPSGGDYAALERERASGVPIVFLDREPRGIESDTVVVDNEGGAEQAIERLVSHGHERIALIIGDDGIDTMRRRMVGAQRAMKRAGILLSQAPTLVGVGDRSQASASVGQLLDSASPPTAIFCASSEITIGAIDEVYRRRIDLAIVGFEGLRLAELMPVPLTLVETDPYELGRTAAELLYRRLDHPDRPVERIVLPVRMKDFPGTAVVRPPAGR